MPRCYDYDDLIAYICLIYHSGQVEYVPGIICNDPFITISIFGPPPFHLSIGQRYDPLLLGNLDLSKIGTDEDIYRQYVIIFLQDPARSGKYTIGPETYTKATCFFLDKIAELYRKLETYIIRKAESDLSGNLTVHNDTWVLDISMLTDLRDCGAADIFLCLGYIIFFLPRCGKSKRLFELCQQQSFFILGMRALFPERSGLVLQAMQDYKEQVGTEFTSIGKTTSLFTRLSKGLIQVISKLAK